MWRRRLTRLDLQQHRALDSCPRLCSWDPGQHRALWWSPTSHEQLELELELELGVGFCLPVSAGCERKARVGSTSATTSAEAVHPVATRIAAGEEAVVMVNAVVTVVLEVVYTAGFRHTRVSSVQN